MNGYESLSHTRWECKYHIVFIPKYRRKSLYGELRKHLGEMFHELARQRESRIEEGHLMTDHVHMLISIPPKYSVAAVLLDILSDRRFVPSYRRHQIASRPKMLPHEIPSLSDKGAGDVNRALAFHEPHQEKEDQRMDQLEIFKG